MFNRRKQKLAKTSQENIQIYLRIQSQKSFVSRNLSRRAPNFLSKNKLSRI